MFGFKKDRITKIIEAEGKALYKQYDNNMISQIDMHNKMKEQIKLIYSNDSISFNDIVNRKYYLTGFQPNFFIIASSFIVGVMGTWFYALANDLKALVDKSFKAYIAFLVNMVVAILLAVLLVFIVVSITRFSNPKDDFLTKDYELSLIDDTLKQLEEKGKSQKN